MTKRVSLLVALSIILGIHTPCYGLYVMVRSGFGELKADKSIGGFTQTNGTLPTWAAGAQGFNDNNLIFNDSSSLVRSSNCTNGKFEYKNHHNLSVALGGRFDVFDIGTLGIELEILGGYANFKNRTRDFVEGKRELVLPVNGWWFNNHILTFLRPDFLMIKYQKIGAMNLAQIRPMYLSNQRIAGAQINAYWEQYLLDWLSVGIGGGIGGAYVATKMKTLEFWRQLIVGGDGHGGNHYVWWFWNGQNYQSRTKYAHNLALLYNFTCFVRAEKFETLFEVGFRHIGLHEVNDNKIYGHSIKGLANLHSDQVYIGVGRTF